MSLEDPSIALSLGSIKSSTSFTLSASAKQRIGPAAFLEGIPTADGREKVLLPRLFLHREAELREICGRGLVILLGRLVIIIVLDPQVLEAYRREEIARTLQFCRSEVEGISRTGSVSLAHFLRCLTSPVPQATTNECGSTSNDDETLRAVQIALLSHQLAATLALETRLFKKQAASTLESAMGSTGASVFGKFPYRDLLNWSAVTNGCAVGGDGSLLNGNGRGARVDTTRESNYLTRRTSAISPGLPLPPAFSPTSASPPPTPFSAPTASVNVNTAIATGSTNNAFCGALLTRGDVIFFTWRPGAELRVWSSRDLVDVLVGAATSSGPGGAAMGGAVSDGLGDITTSGALPPSATSSSSKTPAEGMLEALVRKYSQLRSPHLLFYLLIAGVYFFPLPLHLLFVTFQSISNIGLYGRSTARILNGLHTQLRRSGSVWECQRVATAQKGGLWAVGHRLTTASGGDSDSILLVSLESWCCDAVFFC